LKPEEKALGGLAIGFIVFGAGAAVVIFAFGGKKGYDYVKLRQEVRSFVGSSIAMLIF
jgi:hypothetical protein